jgi:hypothetical protein
VSINVTLNIDGPREPGYVLEVAEAGAEGMRVLSHLTRSHAALREPADVDRLLRYLESAAAGHGQLLRQITGWLEEEQAASRIRVAGGEYTSDPAGAIGKVRARLDKGKWAAEMLRAALDDAASVTSNLSAAEEKQADDR